MRRQAPPCGRLWVCGRDIFFMGRVSKPTAPSERRRRAEGRGLQGGGCDGTCELSPPFLSLWAPVKAGDGLPLPEPLMEGPEPGCLKWFPRLWVPVQPCGVGCGAGFPAAWGSPGRDMEKRAPWGSPSPAALCRHPHGLAGRGWGLEACGSRPDVRLLGAGPSCHLTGPPSVHPFPLALSGVGGQLPRVTPMTPIPLGCPGPGPHGWRKSLPAGLPRDLAPHLGACEPAMCV